MGRSFKYCVVSFMPDIPADETINIGIEMHDMETKVLYRMYTKNVEEISRRYGYSPVLPMVLGGLNQPPDIEDDKDYLNKKHDKPNNGYERLFWSDVRGGLILDAKPEDSLKDLYGIFILIDKHHEKVSSSD